MSSLISMPTFERRDSVFTSLQCKSSAYGSDHYDLLCILHIADQLNIDILPITWMTALGRLGIGGQGQVEQSLINAATEFAFKRSRRTVGQNDGERHRAIVSEMVVLRSPEIRDHPNIIDLVGLGWDFDKGANKFWPVLIFPKASEGNLKKFLVGPQGKDLSLKVRLTFCENIISAMAKMHSCRILHGDLKPENIVVSKDINGNFKAQLIDFGYSCHGMLENDLINIPFSPPWTAPEHEWKDYRFESAEKMDIYSVGMCCAYIIFNKNWQKLLQKVNQADHEMGQSAGFASIYGNPSQRSNVFDELLQVTEDMEVPLAKMPFNIVQFLRASLANSPQDRVSNLSSLANIFNNNNSGVSENLDHINNGSVPLEVGKCVGETAVEPVGPPLTITSQLFVGPPHGVPTIHRRLHDHEYLDYRIREYLFAILLSRASDAYFCPDCSYLAAVQVSYCYKIGFGVTRNPAQAEIWRNSLLEKETHVADPNELRARIAYDITTPVDTSQDSDVSLQFLIARGILYYSLPDQLTMGNSIEKVIPKIEAECLARVIEFGESSGSALYFKILLSRLYEKVGRDGEARALQRCVYQICRETEPDGLNTLTAREIIIEATRARGDIREEKSMLRDLIKDTRNVCGSDHPLVIDAMYRLVGTLSKCGEYQEAEEILKEVIEGNKRIWGEMHFKTLLAEREVANFYNDQGRLTEAEAQSRHILNRLGQISEPHDLQRYRAHFHLGKTLLSQRNFEEAEQHFLRVFEGLTDLLGLSDTETLEASLALSTLYCHQSRFEKAEEFTKLILQKRPDANDFREGLVRIATSNMAAIKTSKGEYREAEVMFLSIISQTDENSSNLLVPQANLGDMYSKEGNLDAAQYRYRKALSLAERTWKPPHQMILFLSHRLGKLLQRCNEAEESKILLEQAAKQEIELFGHSAREMPLNIGMS